jgi:hypothetical protein
LFCRTSFSHAKTAWATLHSGGGDVVRKNERFAGRACALQEPDGPPTGLRFGGFGLSVLMLAATLRWEQPCSRELAAERFPSADVSAIS